MAARIGEQRVVREPVARNEHGAFVRHESGLLLRLDLVDSGTGEVFEVHGARPDEPATREVRVATLEFRLEPGNWEELPFRWPFGDSPSVEDRDAFVELLRSWSLLAAAGGFAALREGADADAWSGRLHSIDVRTHESDVAAILDLGTCPPGALDVLAQALAAFSRERTALTAVSIGGRP
jgi:hypothetical protein